MSVKKITYAGHSAVFIEAKEQRIAIDPWLKENPLCPEELKKPESFDLICLTHGHADHASDVVRLVKAAAASGKQTKVAATFELAVVLSKEGVPQEQLIFLNKGGSTDSNGIRISLTHAMHSSSFDTKDGTVYCGEPCGVVLGIDGSNIYHAGDTALFSDMKLIREEFKPKVAFLPIGDCYTMGPWQAQKALTYLQPQIAVPIHYGTFPGMTGTPENFADLCKSDPQTEKINIEALKPGQSLTVN